METKKKTDGCKHPYVDSDGYVHHYIDSEMDLSKELIELKETTNENLVNNSNHPHSNELKQIINKLKMNKMETKMKLPFGIKQPTTVDEFRNNLKKYYITVGDNLYLMNGPSIPLEKISSFDDIYKITKTGFYGNGTSPSITPRVLLKKDFTEWMNETYQSITFFDYFFNEENFEIIEEHDEFLKRGNPSWWSLDNQIMREFYIITLGDYCGYGMNV